MRQRNSASIVGILAISWAGLSAGDERSVAWLADAQRPPATPAKFAVGAMAPLLTSSAGEPVTKIADWQKKRAEIQSAWEEFLGPKPPRPTNLGVAVQKTEQVGAVERSLIRYEVEPGLTAEAYLLYLSDVGPGRRPGIVALHPTTVTTSDEYAGVRGEPAGQLGLRLAQRGFVVICPRNFLWGEAPNLNEAVARFRKRNPKSLGMRKMLTDAQRATDVLVSLPIVDPNRLGAIGHSLGAKEVLYLSAFDERIRAGVASEGGIALASTNWEAPWYLGPDVRKPGFPRNHHELLALVAPRTLLILGGESGPGAADGDRSWPLLEAALPVHRLFPGKPKLGLLNHHQGHSFSEEAYRKSLDWLETYLAP